MLGWCKFGKFVKYLRFKCDLFNNNLLNISILTCLKGRENYGFFGKEK